MIQLKEWIRRYALALDEAKLHNAFLQLWSLLESLVGAQNANYKQMVKRAAFFYKDHSLAREILNHLRERRNRAIHAGQSIEDAEVLVFQAKQFCEFILRFLLSRSYYFKSFEEYRQFLDCPTDLTVLDRRMKLLKRAKKFRGK